MASQNKKKARKTYLLIVTIFAILLLGFPLSVFLSSKPDNNQQVLQAANANVSIIDFQFSPATLTIPVGTTVTWTNMSASGSFHTTSSDTGGTANSWDSGLTKPGQTFSHTFTQAGTFTYHCNVHTFMRGTIVVTASAPPPAPTATTVPTQVPPTSTPATVVPSPNCLGSCPTPTSTIQPTTIPTLSVNQPSTTPGTTITPIAGGSGNQNAISLLLYFILLILHFLQSLL